MSFTSQYPISCDNIKTVFPVETITVIWEAHEDIQTDRQYFMDVLGKKNPQLLCVISTENPFLPFLSTEDNLLLGIDKNRKNKRTMLYQMLESFELDRHILKESPDNLSYFTTVELLLVRSLICKQELIIIDSILDHLPTQQVQILLELLRRLCKNQQIAIVLFTENKQIAESSYGDVTLSLYHRSIEKMNK